MGWFGPALSLISGILGQGQQNRAGQEAGGLFNQAAQQMQQAEGLYQPQVAGAQGLESSAMNAMQGFIQNPGQFDAKSIQGIMSALGPMFANIQNLFQTGGMRDINSFFNQMGPGMANQQGQMGDAVNSLLQGQTNVAAQNAATGAQAGLQNINTNLQGIGQGFGMGNSIISQLAQLFGQGAQMSMGAGEQIAGNLANSPNPWGGLVSSLMDPGFQSMISGWNLFGGGNTGGPQAGTGGGGIGTPLSSVGTPSSSSGGGAFGTLAGGGPNSVGMFTPVTGFAPN